jgi:hypothetical protein
MKTGIIILISVLFYLCLPQLAIGQPHPPPPPSVGHSNTNDQPAGGGAPVGSGVMILLSLSAAYGAKKIYSANREENGI